VLHSAQAQRDAPWLHLLPKALDASGQDYNLGYLWTTASPSTPVQEFVSYPIYHIAHRTTHLMFSNKSTYNRIPAVDSDILWRNNANSYIRVIRITKLLNAVKTKKKKKYFYDTFSLCVIFSVNGCMKHPWYALFLCLDRLSPSYDWLSFLRHISCLFSLRF
jgi:hypothetical protein